MSHSKSFQLSAEELQFFNDNGFVGPFTLFEPDEMAQLWSDIRLDLLDKANSCFPDSKLNYDRHLDIKKLSDMISSPKIVDRVGSIMGKDLLCWRTEWFPKYPGDEGTDWHQAESFVEYEGTEKLFPTEEHDGPWELTCWVAMSDANKKNGCMKVMPGTHHTWFFDEKKNIEFQPELINQKLTDGKKSGFYGYDYDKLKLDPDWKPDEAKARLMEMKAGQFFIFTSRTLHGSEPNSTKDDIRFGWATRFVPADVQVYPEQPFFKHFGEVLPLDQYSTVLVSGQNNYNHNKVSKPL